MKILLVLLAASCFAPASAQAESLAPEPVRLAAEIDAVPAQVWQALTTREGVLGFFAGEARVEARIGGAYELYFLRDNPPGLRGSENVRILAMEAPGRLLVSWNAPPIFGPLRDQQTVVEFQLSPASGGRTFVAITHFGWGRGPAWQAVRDYFATAGPVVLGRLQYRFERGPVDWRNPPDGASYFRRARAEGDRRN